MEERESNERKNLFIRTIIVVILLLLAFLSTILYVYLYPKTRVFLYDTDYTPIRSFEVKRYSNLESLPDSEKSGYTFKYWTYDDFEVNGGTILNKQAELTSETVSLYANYQANKYRVTYHVQYFDETLGQYLYKTYTPPRNTYPEIYEYGSKIDCLPTGRDAFNNLLPDFSNRPGYHFVGWTTKVVSEDDPDAKNYLKYAGQEYVIDIPSDIDFYAYFEKNTYKVNMHTGIQYQLDENNNPKKDENGEYIIKNITGDTNNDRDSLVAGDNKVRYMDNLVEFTSQYSDIKLTEKNGGMAYAEYEFKGWYLDEDYKLAIKDQNLQLLITENGRPYYKYKMSDGTTQNIYAFDTGEKDMDDNPIYEFNLYSKWQRKQYEISFNKNSNSASGKITSIYLYKVFLDDNDTIIDEYGKYYNDGEFTYEGYENGGHYCRVNLETLDIVDQKFRDSNKNYRLVGWTDSANTQSSDTIKYAWWQQEPWTETLGENRQTGLVSYDNSVYKHTLSQDVTLYAQWSRLYTIKFAYDQTSTQKYFEYKGIEKEWFILPNMADIIGITGSEWTKKYSYFAGWKTGTSAMATKYLEYKSDGSINPEFMFTIARTNSTLIVHWVKTPYTINFYLNDNDDSNNGGEIFDTFTQVYGGTYKYFTSLVPTREGYIFDGWSLTDYKTNEYASIKRQIKDGESVGSYNSVYTSSSNFLITGDCNYYASWTTNFEIEYDPNGGEFAGNATTKYTYSANGSGNLKINLYVGNGQKSISRENYIFKGWKIQGADGNIHDEDELIKTSDVQRTTFDFYKQDGKYYYYKYKADGITVGDSEKTEMYVKNDRKVVLMAVWEPKKYNVTIKDTLASGDKTSTQITITVAFNEQFTFPDKNAQNVPFDNKIGYKLIGFAKTEGGDVEYAIAEDGSYPTIDAGVISKNTTFYTVYEQRNIRVEFKAKMPDDTIENFDAYTMPTVAYGATITMPNIPTVTFGSKVLKFKYWYYEKDGDEIKIASGDKVTYHDEDNLLVIYGHFEVDSYTVTVGISNPYTNQSLIIDQFSLGTFEKDSQITENLYRETMNEVYSKLEVMLADYVLDKTTVEIDQVEYITSLKFKGFSLVGLCATGGYEDYFTSGRMFNTTDFRILGFTTSGMTIATMWNINNVDIVYNSDESENPISHGETVLFTYSPIILQGGDYLTISGKDIRSWYLKDGENKVFLDLSSTLVGVGSKYGYSTLNDLQEYISWDQSTGKGTLNIYANTAQVCTIEYYTFTGSGTPSIIATDSFIFDDSHTLLGSDSAIIGTYESKNFRFNGWFLQGDNTISFAGDSLATVTRSYFNESNGYTIKLYADLTINKSVYLLKVNGSITSEELLENEIVSLLKMDSDKNYFYATSIVIGTYPELTDDKIPTGYDYYGLRFGDKTFTIDQITNNLAIITITGDDIKLVTYFTKEYTITYSVIDGATFADDSTADKVEKYLIGIDGIIAEDKQIKINYSAKKVGYENCFDGWRIKYDNNTIGEEKYSSGNFFTPVDTNTLFVPVFTTPQDGTINAKIKLIKEDGSSTSITYSWLDEDKKPCVDMPSEDGKRITNGYQLSFADVQSLWTEGTRDLYKWVDSDGNEYDAVTGKFTIPSAIQNDQEFIFTGVWIDKYYIKFTQPQEYISAEGYEPTVSVHKGTKYLLDKTPIIKVNGEIVEGVEFEYWTYQLGDQIINIPVGDSIVLNSDEYSTYKYLGNADGTGTHYLPALPTGNYEYQLIGSWDSISYEITLKVASPVDSQIYTLTLYGVPFGTSIGSRDMLDFDYIYLKQNDAITIENSNNLTSIKALITDDRGIVGWSNTQGGAVDAEILNSIKSNKTVYAVWQVKQQLKFADENDSFGYNTDSPEILVRKYLPTEQVDVNNIIEYIYKKGYATVHLEDGKWILYKENDGITEEYYYLSGLSSNTVLTVNGKSTTSLQLNENGQLPLFEMPASDVVLTPELSRIYRVNFWDNTTSSGGNIVKNNEDTIKYNIFLKAEESLNLSSFVTSRTNFTFLGWNTDKDSDDYKDSITASTSDINVYAIWASNRRAKFQISLASANGVTNQTLLEMPLTKDNKINTTILQNYLDGKNVSSNNIQVFASLDSMVDLSKLGHSAYTYNFRNYLLNGFVISKNGISTIFDMSQLGEEDFGNSANYSQNENVTITFNLYDIYSITYNSNATGVANLDRVDYFVVSGDNIGKLIEKTKSNPNGIESSITLPNLEDLHSENITRLHYSPTMWSTSDTISASSITYSMSNADNLNLTTERLKTIASYLQNKFTQTYTLYIIWEYELIDVYVYAPAEVINTELPENQDKADTTLIDPYPVYRDATSAEDISFKNIPDILSINGKSILAGNYKYNNGTIAQIRYNDTFKFTSNLNYSVGGYTLVGFSTTLYRLGEVVSESNYKKLDTSYVVDETLASEDIIVFYPVYVYDTKEITIYSYSGEATVTSGFAPKDSTGNTLTPDTAGLVYLDSTSTTETTITSYGNKQFTVNIHTSIVINANSADEGYVFEKFSSSIDNENAVTTAGVKNIGTINIPLIYTNEYNSNIVYSYTAEYGASKVKVNFSMDYGTHTLKSGIVDNYSILLSAVDSNSNYNEKTINRLNQTVQISTTSDRSVYYSLRTDSDYYTFEIYCQDKLINLKEGTDIDISKLDLSGDKDSDDAYIVDIVIKAIPKTNTVTFIMNRGVFKENTTISAESAIFENVSGFAISGNIATVYTGSTITLPTANDITYSRGKFVKFYINADSEKTQVTTYTINQNLTFVEDFDDNAYTIQYNYNGHIEYVSGLTPNSTVKIGYLFDTSNVDNNFANKIDTNRAGYTLQYWTFENGDKAFDDGEEIILTKSYILYAKYIGNSITYRYTYPTGKTVDKLGYNGADIILLDPATINDADINSNQYIYGWIYNGYVFSAPDVITFDKLTELGYVYSSDNDVVIFEAKIYDSYEYVITYVTTTENGELTNKGEFTDQTFYVRKLPDNKYFESDLNVHISDKTPIISGSYYFDKYTVEYSEDGDSYISQDITLKVGGLLNLATPKEGKTIRYRLTPVFTSTNSTITINYNLTNPKTNESINELTTNNQSVKSLITGLSFNAGLSFSDDYMLQMTSNEGSDNSSFAINSWNVSFQLQITNLDWFEYTLKGYSVSLFLGEENKGSRNFYFGNALKEDRNISGVDKAELTPIWEKKYVINYFDKNNTLITKQYIPYSSEITEITTLTQTIATSGATTYDGYACVGWTKISDNNHIITTSADFVAFAGNIAISEFDSDYSLYLYPAQSKIYTLSFESAGIDDSDQDNFVFNSFDLPNIYLGINDSNSITLNNYLLSANNYFDYSDLSKLYSSYNSTKYTFLGFASSLNADPSTTYTFDSNAIVGNTIKVYVVWQKNAYTIKFTFEAKENNGSNNLLSGYSFDISKFYGDSINLKWDYDLNSSTFSMEEATQENNSWISNIKNSDGIALIEKINTILQEKSIDYLSAIKFTHLVAGVETEIDVEDLFDIVGDDAIKISFVSPLVRLTYNVYYGTKFKGEEIKTNTELYSQRIAVGSQINPQIDIADLEYAGYVIDFWTADNSTNFFPNGSRTISATDIENSKLTNNYRLKIYIHFTTAYKLNFYYFASLEDLLNNKYTQLGSTMDVKLGDTIGIYQTDENGNYKYDSDGNVIGEYLDGTTLQKTIFDDYISTHNINIVLDKTNNTTVKINNFHDFFEVFKDYEYVSEGEVKVNQDESLYQALIIDGHAHNILYQVRTYAGDNQLENNVYLTYEAITHKVAVKSIVAVQEGTNIVYNQNIASKYNVYAEYATTLNQITNDSGDSETPYEDMRNLADTYNDSSFYSESMSYLDNIYLINAPFAVRGGKDVTDFIFQGWKVLVQNEGTITFEDISAYGLTITPVVDSNTNTVKYWTVSNIKEDITIVAVYTEYLIDINITLRSEDGNGDKLGLSVLTQYGSRIDDYSNDASVITTNEIEHTTTYNLKVLFNSELSLYIPEDLDDSYQLKLIRIGNYETKYFVTIGVNNNNIDSATKQINIEVIYAQLSYQLLIKADQTINNVRYNATLDKIAYTVLSTDDTPYQLESSTTLTNNDFGYTAEISAGAIIYNDKLGTPVLNNFTFAYWEYYDYLSASWVSLKDETNGIEIVNIVNEIKEVKVRAVFIANDVTIKYVVNRVVGTDTVQKEISDLTTTAKYGSTITLPYVIIENENYITNGYDNYKFGENLLVVADSNNLLDTLTLVLVTEEISYVVFDKGDTQFTIPSDYPTVKDANNKIAMNKITIPANTPYYYYTISNEGNLNGTGHTITNATQVVLVDSSYQIPNVEIAQVNGTSFAYWVTKYNRNYALGETYDYLLGESENNLITLTAVESNYINVKFYITNPSTTDTLNLTTKVGQTADLPYINVLISKENNNNYVDIDYTKSASEYINVNSMISNTLDVAYFANLPNYEKYKFYGWSVEKVIAFNNINEYLTSSDNYDNNGSKYLSRYAYLDDNGIANYSKYSIQTYANNLAEFIKKTGITELYSVWEKKYEVSFQDVNGTVYVDKTTNQSLAGYYGQGEIVSFPNADNLNLSQTSLEWIGWQEKDGDRKFEFVNGQASMTFSGTTNQIWNPLWETGYTLTLDMNFNNQRQTVASVLSQYGITQDTILANTGYPFFASLDSGLKKTGTLVNIGDKTYSSSYQYGTLWTVKSSINLIGVGTPVDSYQNDEDIETIYPITFAPTFATWLNSYYTFAGWSKTADGSSGILTNEQLSNIKLVENTTLYAMWQGIELKVYLSATQADATYNSSSLSKILLQANNNSVNNPISITFGEPFNVRNYESDSYVSNYNSLINHKTKKFDKWNVLSPMTQETLHKENFYIANDLYLYPDYVDCYTVVFKTTNGEVFSAQGENLENCQRVIDGDVVTIKSYIKDTLEQDLNMITYVSFINNEGNNIYLYDVNNKDWTISRVFNSSELSLDDKNNKTFTIIVDISFEVQLYAPESTTSNRYVRKGEINITPEKTIEVLRKGVYSSEYQLDLSTYNNVPEFAGWYYYDNQTLTSSDISNRCYQVYDLSSAVVSYKLTALSGKYYIVTYDIAGNENRYELNSRTFNLYAKLTVTQEITLGNADDEIIQKYAELSVVEDNYVSVISTQTISDKVKTITIVSAYNSDRAINFKISAQGYIINNITKTLSTTIDLGYIANNDNLSDEQKFEENTIVITKSSQTSKVINESITNGMFNEYTLAFKNIRENNRKFAIGITPYVFSVEYKVNNTHGLFRTMDDTDFKDSDAITMTSEGIIYQTITNGDKVKAYESNKIAIPYTLTVGENNITTLKFTNVPYSMNLQVKYLPQEVMLMRFVNLTFDWTDVEWSVDEENNAIISSISVSSGDAGKSIKYNPVENSNGEYKNTYVITVNFDNNKIKNIELYLDHENSTEAYETNNAWTNILNKVVGVSITGDSTYTRYSMPYSSSVTSDAIYAGDNLSALFTNLKANIHSTFDSSINNGDLGDQNSQISLATAMNYFWLDDNTPFQTYSKDLAEVSADGYLYFDKDNNKNIIYSLHNGTVKLHIDLEKAILVDVGNRILDYLDNQTIIADETLGNATVDRANVSLVRAEGTQALVYENNNLKDYVDNTLANRLQVKMPYLNSYVTFTTTPAGVTNNHVSYKMNRWVALGGTIATTSQSENSLIINGNNANNDITGMFATFGNGATQYKAPEIHLRGDVVAKTYNLNFKNADGSNILASPFEIAYDQDIYNLNGANYYYYNYSLNNLRISEKHIIPLFSLVASDTFTGIRFVHPEDSIESNYGDLQYLYRCWSNSKDGNEYNASWLLANKVTNSEGAVVDYYDINMYAVYTKCQKITVVTFVESGEDTQDLYLAPLGFVDQFGFTYDGGLHSENYSITSWIKSNKGSAVLDANNHFEYYLKGINNSSNIKVNSLQDIANAYSNNASVLAEVNTYRIYPKVEISIVVYKHHTDIRYSTYEKIYYTLGGKIVFDLDGNMLSSNTLSSSIVGVDSNLQNTYSFSYNSNNLVLSNLIWEDDQTYMDGLYFSVGQVISPEIYADYSFAFWYVNNQYVVPFLSGEVNVISNATIYPHYNVKFAVSNSATGSSKIFSGESETSYSVGEWVYILDDLSGECITAESNPLRHSFALEYSTCTVDNNGYTYALLNVKDVDAGTNLYTIKFVANEKQYEDIAFEIVASNGKSQILTLKDIIYIEDSYGSYKIMPVAYPNEVKITISNQLVVSNLPDIYQHEEAMNLSVVSNPLIVAGGAVYKFSSLGSGNNVEYIISFNNMTGQVLGGKTITMSASNYFEDENLGEYLTNFRWQYKSGAEWIDCDENSMIAIQDITIRLACDWITYNVLFEKMNEVTSPNYVYVGDKQWTISDTVYSNYSINNAPKLLFKGETLIFDYNTSTFSLISDIYGRSTTITISKPDDATLVGWVVKNSSGLEARLNGLVADDTFSAYNVAENNLSFVAWVENTKNSTIVIDKSVENYGYVDINVVVESPLGLTDQNITTTIGSREYTNNIINVGYSSHITFTLTELDNLHHQMLAFNYNGESKTINEEREEITYSGITGAELNNTIKVSVDAEPTKSYYYILDSYNKILNTYTIYGGYYVTYAYNNATVTGEMYNFWGEKIQTFVISYNENKTNVISGNTHYYYPNAGYSISALDLYKAGIINENNNIITSPLDTVHTIANLTGCLQQTSSYIGDKIKFALKYVEYVSTATLNFRTITTRANGNVENVAGASVMANNTLNYLTTINVADIALNEAIFTLINRTRSGIELRVSDVYSCTIPRYTIGEDKKRTINLASVEVVEDLTSSTQAQLGYWDESNDGDNSDFAMTSPIFTVLVYVEEQTTTKLSFKLTLPNDADFRNIKLSATMMGASQPQFNSIDGDGKLNEITVEIGSKLSIENDGKVLKISSPNRSYEYQITINGDISSTSVYSFYGWYLDTVNHSLTTQDCQIGGISYKLYSFDSSASEITSDSLLITERSTLVLYLDRAEVKIYRNTSSWQSVVDVKNILDSQAYATLDTLDYTSNHGSLIYTLPGGLFQLTPAVLTEDTYSTGATTGAYLGVNNSTRNPLEISNRYREQNVKDNARSVFNITLINDTDNIIDTICGTSQFYYSGYLIKDLNNNNSYDVELTKSNRWVLVEYPAKLNAIDITYYTCEYGTSNNESITLQYSRKDIISLPTIRIANGTAIQYTTFRNNNSRLYQDLLGVSGYDSSTITFRTLDADRNYLKGYKVIISNGKTISETKTLDLTNSDFAGASVEVYPIFVSAYIVTINGPFGDNNAWISKDYEVIPETEFTFTYTVDTVSLTYNNAGSKKNFQTIRLNNQVLASMVDSMGTEYVTLLRVSQGTLSQVNKTLQFSFTPVSDVIIQASMMDVISTLTKIYSCSNYSNYSHLSFNKDQSFTYKDVPSGVDPVPSKTNFSLSPDSSYFSVSNVAHYGSPTNGYYGTYTIKHNSHNWISNGTTTSTSGCEIKHYNKYYCNYCNASKKEYSNSTYDHNYQWTSWEYYSTSVHARYYQCTRCSKIDKTATQGHDYQDTYSTLENEQHHVTSYCPVCNHSKTSKESCSGTKRYIHVNDDIHKWTYTCAKCTGSWQGTGNHHKSKTLKTTKATCIAAATITYKCDECLSNFVFKDGEKDPNNHAVALQYREAKIRTLNGNISMNSLDVASSRITPSNESTKSVCQLFCSACDYEVNYDHNFKSWTSGTCVKYGTKTCGNCNYTCSTGQYGSHGWTEYETESNEKVDDTICISKYTGDGITRSVVCCYCNAHYDGLWDFGTVTRINQYINWKTKDGINWYGKVITSKEIEVPVSLSALWTYEGWRWTYNYEKHVKDMREHWDVVTGLIVVDAEHFTCLYCKKQYGKTWIWEDIKEQG